MVINNSITMTDHMTSTLRSIIRTINIMITNLQRIDSISSSIGNNAFNSMRNEITAAEVSLQNLENQLIAVDMAQSRASSGAGSWSMRLMGVYSAVGLITAAFSSISRTMNFVDSYTTANARLGLINDGLQTQLQLQEEIAAAANRSRASYEATAKLVTSIGMTGAMESTKAAVDFSERVNKLLVIGGADAGQSEAAVLQLSQALASGTLQGDEYRSLRENAPALMKTIADGMGVSMGTLKEMSTDGQLTAQAIIAAMEKAGGTIDEQFSKMPVTFSQNMQMMKDTFGIWASGLAENGALKALNEIFKKFNIWLSSDSGQHFLNNVAAALSMIAYIALLASDGLSVIMNIIDMISPVADILFFGVLITGAILAGQALWTMVPPLAASAAAFIAMNLPIILVSAAIAAVIVLLGKLGIRAEDVAMFIGGLIGGVVAFFGNQIIMMRNILISIAEFFMNIFIDPVYAVKKLFYDLTKEINGFFSGMINAIIDGLNWIITKTNSIAKTSFKTISHIEIDTMKAPTSSKNVVNLDKYKTDYLSYNDFASKGAGFMMGALNKMQSFKDSAFGGADSSASIQNIDKVGKVGKIDSDVNIAKEDIKYLLDSVTQKYVNNINLTVQTAAPVINNSGTVREEADIEKVASKLSDILLEKTEVAV